MKHYIYIPGLGDHFDLLRKLILRVWWQKRDVKVTFVPMRWADRHETYEEKYQRVAAVIEQAHGDVITLVGESASGAMTMLVLSRHAKDIEKVVTICGYNHGAADIHPMHKIRHPAFPELLLIVDPIVEKFSTALRNHITTIYSTADLTVTPQHSRIDGAKAIVLRTPGHLTNIARVLLGRFPLKIDT